MAYVREAGLRRRRHAIPVVVVHVLAVVASPPLPVSLCFSFPATVHGALTLRGAVERPEAARDIEGCPLGVQSMEPHKAPGITRGVATKGGSVAATRALYRARSCIESVLVLL